jgi:hypothetical protein
MRKGGVCVFMLWCGRTGSVRHKSAAPHPPPIEVPAPRRGWQWRGQGYGFSACRFVQAVKNQRCSHNSAAQILYGRRVQPMNTIPERVVESQYSRKPWSCPRFSRLLVFGPFVKNCLSPVKCGHRFSDLFLIWNYVTGMVNGSSCAPGKRVGMA